MNSLKRIGNEKVLLENIDKGDFLSISLASNYTIRSDSNFVLNGIPISMYEDESGNKAFSVYDISDGGFGIPEESDNTYVDFGLRFSYLEAGNDNIMRAKITAEAVVQSSDHTIWRGVQVSLSSSSEIICKKITGTISKTSYLYMGGVPLTAVQIGNDWAIAIGSV